MNTDNLTLLQLDFALLAARANVCHHFAGDPGSAAFIDTFRDVVKSIKTIMERREINELLAATELGEAVRGTKT